MSTRRCRWRQCQPGTLHAEPRDKQHQHRLRLGRAPQNEHVHLYREFQHRVCCAFTQMELSSRLGDEGSFPQPRQAGNPRSEIWGDTAQRAVRGQGSRKAESYMLCLGLFLSSSSSFTSPSKLSPPFQICSHGGHHWAITGLTAFSRGPVQGRSSSPPPVLPTPCSAQGSGRGHLKSSLQTANQDQSPTSGILESSITWHAHGSISDCSCHLLSPSHLQHVLNCTGMGLCAPGGMSSHGGSLKPCCLCW